MLLSHPLFLTQSVAATAASKLAQQQADIRRQYRELLGAIQEAAGSDEAAAPQETRGEQLLDVGWFPSAVKPRTQNEIP